MTISTFHNLECDDPLGWSNWLWYGDYSLWSDLIKLSIIQNVQKYND
jgi:hypothetical protein